MINYYIMGIDGLTAGIETPNVKYLWSYLIKHYKNLNSNGSDKLDNFNTTVLDYLCKDIDKRMLDEHVYTYLVDLNVFNYSTELADITVEKVIKQTVLEKLTKLPNHVSDQVLDQILKYLSKQDMGISYSCTEVEK